MIEYLIWFILVEIAIFLLFKILNEFGSLCYEEPEKIYCGELSKKEGEKLMSELFGDDID